MMDIITYRISSIYYRGLIEGEQEEGTKLVEVLWHWFKPLILEKEIGVVKSSEFLVWFVVVFVPTKHRSLIFQRTQALSYLVKGAIQALL